MSSGACDCVASNKDSTVACVLEVCCADFGDAYSHVLASTSASAETQVSRAASRGTAAQASSERRNSDSRAAIAAITRGANQGAGWFEDTGMSRRSARVVAMWSATAWHAAHSAA